MLRRIYLAFYNFHRDLRLNNTPCPQVTEVGPTSEAMPPGYGYAP